jgi:hypothetical protein
MMRWTATLVSAVVTVFSLTFVVTRRTADEAPKAAQLVASSIAAGTPLRVRTLRGVPALPRLRHAPSGAAAAAAAAAGAAAAPLPPPPPSAAPPAPPEPVLCARAAWAGLTGGVSPLVQPGRC